MHGLFRMSYGLNPIFHGDSHQVNRLVVNPPCSTQDQIFHWFYGKRNPRSNLITLDAFFPILLVEITPTDIESKFRMQLPLILQKTFEFVTTVVHISENWLVDVYTGLPFLNVVLILCR